MKRIITMGRIEFLKLSPHDSAMLRNVNFCNNSFQSQNSKKKLFKVYTGKYTVYIYIIYTVSLRRIKNWGRQVFFFKFSLSYGPMLTKTKNKRSMYLGILLDNCLVLIEETSFFRPGVAALTRLLRYAA